ncbi:MAG: hypothetical protein JXA52_09950 [Planctomycetes bacterium]|nr:hypothetical protein [Planctomycetota bacterium]
MVKLKNEVESKDSEVSSKKSIRDEIKKRRKVLFHSDWRNPKQIQPLVSREEDNSFRFLIEWCEEFETVIGKQRERLSDPNPRIK